MDFVTAVKTCLQQKYFDLTGRASKHEFWWFALFYLIVAIVGTLIGGIIHWIVQILIILPVIPPFIAVGWRRFQDIGMPGNYILVTLIGMVLSIIGQILGSLTIMSIAGVIGLIAFIFVVVMLIKPSEPQPNAHGPVPLA